MDGELRRCEAWNVLVTGLLMQEFELTEAGCTVNVPSTGQKFVLSLGYMDQGMGHGMAGLIVKSGNENEITKAVQGNGDVMVVTLLTPPEY